MPSDPRLDALIDHRIGLEQYGTSVLKQLLPVLQAAEADVVDIVQNRLFDNGVPSASEVNRLTTVLRTVRKAQLEAYDVMFRRLMGEMKGLATHEADWAKQFYENRFQVQTALDVPSASVLVAAALERPMSGRTLKAWTQKMRADHVAQVEQQIRLGVIEGESIDQMTKRLRGTEAYKGRDGLFARHNNSARALVRTAVNHISNAAHQSFLGQNPNVFRTYTWSSVLDNRTTPLCRSRSGNVYEYGKGPIPPAHVSCRSTIIGNVHDPQTGERVSSEVEEKTYQEWLEDQAPARQVLILGKAKAALFRDGRLPLDRYVDYTGRELTLSELKRRERDAWEQAFVSPGDRRSLSVTRRLNHLVNRSSETVRPYAETASRAWDFVRYKSNEWLEAGWLQSKPIDPNVWYALTAMDFFTGPPIVSFGFQAWPWRSAFRRGLKAQRAGLVYPHMRMPRGLITRPDVRPRTIDGDIRPPARPPADIIQDIDPALPPAPRPPKPVVPPPPDERSIIYPPRDRTPAVPDRPAGDPTPPRPPGPTEKLPPALHVVTDKGALDEIPKVADDVKVPTPPTPVKYLPDADPAKKIPALADDVAGPRNPLNVTVDQLEKRLDDLLPPEGTKLDADGKLAELIDELKKGGHDGIAIVDQNGKPRIVIGIGEKEIKDAVERWRIARRQIDETAKLPRDVEIDDGVPAPGVQPGTPPAIPPVRPPPAEIPAQGVPKDMAKVAQAELEAGRAAEAARRLRPPVTIDRVEAARKAAREIAEARRLLAENRIRDLLYDLDDVNAGLEGTKVISKLQAARADALQRLIQNNRLGAGMTLYRPLRWSEYAKRLGPSPARLTDTIIETPAFTSVTADQRTALSSASKRGRGPLVLFRIDGKTGDAMLAGNIEANEYILPAGSRFRVTGMRRMQDSEIPASLRRTYPKDQEFWAADADIVRAGDATDQKIVAARVEQERFATFQARTALDNEAEQALRHTPFVPYQAVDEPIGVWPEYDAKSGTMMLGKPLRDLEFRARDKLTSDAARRAAFGQSKENLGFMFGDKPADPKNLDAAPLFRRGMGDQINRAGRAKPLSDGIVADVDRVGDRLMRNRTETAAETRAMDKGAGYLEGVRLPDRRRARTALAEVDAITLQPGEALARAPSVQRQLPGAGGASTPGRSQLMDPFGDATDAIGDAIARRDPVLLGRIASRTHYIDLSEWQRGALGLDPTRATKEAAELAKGLRLYAELVHGLTRGRAGYRLDNVGDFSAPMPKFAGPQDHAAVAFRAWFGLQYSSNPMWRKILAKTLPDLDGTMRQVLRARAREPLPDAWAPTLRLLHNRRIVADPRTAEVAAATARLPTASQQIGIRESARQRFYDHLERNGSLDIRAQNRLAGELGVERSDVEVLVREAQRAGWVRAHGKGYRVLAEDVRPPRPTGTPSVSATPAMRAAFYDYLDGSAGGTAERFGSLSQTALKDLQREFGASPIQMARLTYEAQELGWLTRDPRGNLRRPWAIGLKKTGTASPPRPQEADIERLEGTLGTPGQKIRPVEAPNTIKEGTITAADVAAGAKRISIPDDDLDDVLTRIASDIRQAPIDKTAWRRLPVRSESERVMVREVWQHATVSSDVEQAIRGAEQPVLTGSSDGPTHYDPVTGTVSPGRLDPARPQDRIYFRHEYGHHLDLPMTPDGTVTQYSAASEFGLPKAMAGDLDQILKTYAPDAPLTMTPEAALTEFRRLYGVDLNAVADPKLAHKMAEYGVTGNAAFLKTVDRALRKRLITDTKLAGELAHYSDMTAAITRLQLGTGHPEAYFQGGFDIGSKYTSRHANEAFANWFALHSSDNPGYRALMRRYFPQASDSAQSILDRIGQDANGE